jgi:hypothetical protein
LANASRRTTGFLAIVSLNSSILQDTAALATETIQHGEGYKAAPPRNRRFPTHVAMLWTVILDELVVNCLVTVGIAVDVVARKALEARGNSLVVYIGNEVGVS